jgi:Cyclic nucleotide-binding domain
MQNDNTRQYFANCPDLAGLDDESLAFLKLRGQEVKLKPGAILYSKGAVLDDTFCLLISGELLVEMGPTVIGRVPENQLLGEMAYFIESKTRSATLRAGPLGAFLMKFRLTRAELATAPFASLKHFLGAQAWDRFVSNSQRNV